MKVNAHTISLTVSSAAIGVYAYRSIAQGNIRSANQLALGVLKTFGIGLSVYLASYVGINALCLLQTSDRKYAKELDRSKKALADEGLSERQDLTDALLIGNGQHCLKIAPAIIDLHKSNLLNDETLSALQTGDGEYSLEICEGIIGLAEEGLSGRKDLMDALLTANGKFAVEIMTAFKCLKDDGILEKKHIEFSFIDEKSNDDLFTIKENNSFVLDKNPSEGTFVFFIEKHPDGTFELLCP